MWRSIDQLSTDLTSVERQGAVHGQRTEALALRCVAKDLLEPSMRKTGTRSGSYWPPMRSMTRKRLTGAYKAQIRLLRHAKDGPPHSPTPRRPLYASSGTGIPPFSSSCGTLLTLDLCKPIGTSSEQVAMDVRVKEMRGTMPQGIGYTTAAVHADRLGAIR